MRALLPLATLLTLLAAPAATALDCSAEAERELRRLGLEDAEIAGIRYVEKRNPSERGPEVLGVRAWVRPQACSSGYLVIDMTRSCFIRQSYSRGDCRLDGVTAY